MDHDDVEIVGWGHTPFGRLPDETLESLIVTAARDAITTAGLQPREIDEIVVGTYNGGLQPLAFPSSLVLQADDDLLFTPATRVENACATGSAALLAGVRAIRSGQARRVLVVGAEKMTHAPAEAIGHALLGADYDRAGESVSAGFAQLFAEVAEAYFVKYGDHGDALARIAAKNHRNGMANPYAHLRSNLGYEFCCTVGPHNPIVAGPLRRTDCCPISDGAAAVVLAAPGSAPRGPAVRIRALAQVNDFLPASRRDLLAFAAAHWAWQAALERAGVRLSDLHLVEVHDCFTIAELIEYEVVGLCGPGGGGEVVAGGVVDRDGTLPVNPSGGLKAKGHPVGATGVSQHVMAILQLIERAGAMQVPGATVAGVFNMGGLTVANYASVLERVR
ncbi:acetyl-CoA acetyltransferase [Candidatus Protofrankia californiensis]|uniref:Acetyl-CoA acetyltransferase n=1 Tax=Candidatus Protofrankia californiensis TaxID=1839754 RepID=A0A1C3PF58_9ACTN|nr:acetyl-CoA acetyltransferase [Candidatus Protofrankia californiensis]